MKKTLNEKFPDFKYVENESTCDRSVSDRSSFYYIENDSLRVIISPLGAEIQSIFDVRQGIEFLWQGDENYWNGKSPILFPIVGRVRNGSYSHSGKTYEIDSPHGFAKRKRFTLESLETERIEFSLESTSETLKQYPFFFRLHIEYALVRTSLQIRIQIANMGEETMPFALGMHPGLRVPIENGERFEDYRLIFDTGESPNRIQLDGTYLSSMQSPFHLIEKGTLGLTHRLFDDEAVVLEGIRTKTVSLVGPRKRKRWRMDFGDFDYLAIWQPKGLDAPFICMETWSGLPDPIVSDTNMLIYKPGIKLLPPQDHTELTLRFAFFD